MKIIYGEKGTGKTKLIIDSANNALDNAKGHVVFISDTTKYSFDIKYQIRLLDTKEFNINSVEALKGFISGIVGANSDNEYIYIDGIARITNKPLSELKDIFDVIAKIEKDYGAKFVLTCSSSKEDLPDFILKLV